MVIIRPAVLSDEPYITQTWVDNFRDSALGHSLGDRLYEIRWREIVRMLLARCITMVAYDEDAPDLMLGFATFEYESPIEQSRVFLHYVYVRFPQRGARVATDMLSLISDRRIIYTHRTTAAQVYTSRHPHLTWTYDFTRIFRGVS